MREKYNIKTKKFIKTNKIKRVKMSKNSAKMPLLKLSVCPDT